MRPLMSTHEEESQQYVEEGRKPHIPFDRRRYRIGITGRDAQMEVDTIVDSNLEPFQRHTRP
jgi:hypothetical protein